MNTPERKRNRKECSTISNNSHKSKTCQDRTSSNIYRTRAATSPTKKHTVYLSIARLEAAPRSKSGHAHRETETGQKKKKKGNITSRIDKHKKTIGSKS